MFFFDFHEYPSQVLDKTLELRVLNSKITFVKLDIIGSFKLDLGMAYDESGYLSSSSCLMLLLSFLVDQSFVQKWLLLTDPDNPILGVKGFLKFSVHVLSPGVIPKPYPPLTNEAIDVET